MDQIGVNAVVIQHGSLSHTCLKVIIATLAKCKQHWRKKQGSWGAVAPPPPIFSGKWA